MADALTETLRQLVQTDIDAAHCYTQAIERVDDAQVAAMLTEFRADHERHILDLSGVLAEQGVSPPDTTDVSGRALELGTSMASRLGAASALLAMESNEVVTNHAYDQALRTDMPDDVRQIVERNRQDEARHLQAIRREIEVRQPATGRLLNQAATLQGWGAAAWMNILRVNPLAAGVLGAATAFLVAQGLRPYGRRLRQPRPQTRPPVPDQVVGAELADKSAASSASVLRQAPRRRGGSQQGPQA